MELIRHNTHAVTCFSSIRIWQQLSLFTVYLQQILTHLHLTIFNLKYTSSNRRKLTKRVTPPATWPPSSTPAAAGASCNNQWLPFDSRWPLGWTSRPSGRSSCRTSTWSCWRWGATHSPRLTTPETHLVNMRPQSVRKHFILLDKSQRRCRGLRTILGLDLRGSIWRITLRWVDRTRTRPRAPYGRPTCWAGGPWNTCIWIGGRWWSAQCRLLGQTSATTSH